MFGLERRMGFIRSLVTDRASQFSEAVTRNISRAGEMAGRVTERATESVGNIASRVPDMILPEDAGSVGSQIMGEVRDSAPEQAFRNVPYQADEAFSSAPVITREVPQEMQDTGSQPGQRDMSPTREIMRKKLNHFQIERLAEQIKERLESEIKVEKERHGEEP